MQIQTIVINVSLRDLHTFLGEQSFEEKKQDFVREKIHKWVSQKSQQTRSCVAKTTTHAHFFHKNFTSLKKMVAEKSLGFGLLQVLGSEFDILVSKTS